MNYNDNTPMNDSDARWYRRLTLAVWVIGIPVYLTVGLLIAFLIGNF